MKGEWFQDREHVSDLLGHAKHALRIEAADGGAINRGQERPSVAVHLVGCNLPAGGLSIENNPLLFSKKGFIRVVERANGQLISLAKLI